MKSNSSGRAIEDDYSDGNSDDDDGEKNETTKKKQQQHQRRRRRHTERRSNATRDFFFFKSVFSLRTNFTLDETKRKKKSNYPKTNFSCTSLLNATTIGSIEFLHLFYFVPLFISPTFSSIFSLSRRIGFFPQSTQFYFAEI